MKPILIIVLISVLFSCTEKAETHLFEGESLVFEDLASTWDEAMPLGNATVGALVWKKEGKLRFSLDRADLWDLRPVENVDFEKWKFQDVYEHWKSGKYRVVQEAFDIPYNQLPAPSKIPAGALEFDIEKLGKIKEVSLDIKTATCVVEWENGVKLTTFVHAEKPLGWYKFENLDEEVKLDLISPAYNRENTEGYTSQSKNDLNQLGYEQGTIARGENYLTYNQKGWGDFAYQIHTSWSKTATELMGCWSVSSENKGWEPKQTAEEVVAQSKEEGCKSAYEIHVDWWQNYWAKSAVRIPDSLLQRQYYLEMYKFGAAARADAPPICLQSVWTADHGKLPPWKGDFHHDLNTQLSYWPAYTGNYLELEEGFVNWLWQYRSTFKKYTKEYFGAEGMNVPGVTTLEGEPMGGWIQYSMGQTVSAWLGHHFYLHWVYSQDRDFLQNRAYPWLKDVAVFLDEMTEKTPEGTRKLQMSSSPEIYNNSPKAWFVETTNFDLALIHWTYEKAAELAHELGLDAEADKWTKIRSEWADLAIDAQSGMMLAPEIPYDESHRHLSHLMAYHPLGLIDQSKGEAHQTIIQNTLNNLEKQGSDYWTGYSFSWQGNLYARAFEGEKAAETLRTFASCFCLKNSFHVNGDQCKAGHSKFTYRPFTLEGNFAFAAAIQEMLIQSHTGIVRLFPAVPASWDEASFDQLRTYGAFLVSAEKKNGQTVLVKVKSEKGGTFRLHNPFDGEDFRIKNAKFELSTDNLICIEMEAGQEIELTKN